MLTGTALINELVDELNELKLSTMAAVKRICDRRRAQTAVVSVSLWYCLIMAMISVSSFSPRYN